MYEISKVAKFEVQHNHTIKTPDLDSRGRVTKNFKNELSGPEISFIESEAKRNTTPRDIINELELKYGYSYNLKLNCLNILFLNWLFDYSAFGRQ